jgi:hypothetical protein
MENHGPFVLIAFPPKAVNIRRKEVVGLFNSSMPGSGGGVRGAGLPRAELLEGRWAENLSKGAPFQ